MPPALHFDSANERARVPVSAGGGGQLRGEFDHVPRDENHIISEQDLDDIFHDLSVKGIASDKVFDESRSLCTPRRCQESPDVISRQRNGWALV